MWKTEHRREATERLRGCVDRRKVAGTFRTEDGCKCVGIYLSLTFHWDFHWRCPVG